MHLWLKSYYVLKLEICITHTQSVRGYILAFTAMHLVDLCRDEVSLAIIRAYLYTSEEVLLLCTCEALFFLDYSFLADSRYNFHIFNVWQDQREEEEYYRSLSFPPLHSDSDPDTD